MSSQDTRNSENDSVIPTCFGKPRECFIHSFLLTVSTLVFVTSMILAVYLTYKASMDKIVALLIVASCLLYILGFSSYMYHIYNSKSSSVISRNDRNSNDLNQATRTSPQSSSTSGRNPDILSSFPGRHLIRNTPPPPYEIQMSEMSRSSRTTNSSTRESEITEEAIKLIRRMYGEIKRVDQQVGQSPRNEQLVQQVAQDPEAILRQQERTIPEVFHSNRVIDLHDTEVKRVPVSGFASSDFRASPLTQLQVSPNSFTNKFHSQRLITVDEGCVVAHPQPLTQKEDFWPKSSDSNLVVKSQETAAKSAPIRGLSASDFQVNQAKQIQVSNNSYLNRLELQKLTIRSEGCTTVQSQPSIEKGNFLTERTLPKVPHPNMVINLSDAAVKTVPFDGLAPSDFHSNQATQQQMLPTSLPNQLDLQRLVAGSEGYISASPQQPSLRNEEFLQIARKRKLTSISKKSQTRPKTKELTSHAGVDGFNKQNIVYEPNEATRNIQNQTVDDSAEYCSIDSETEDSFERSSSVCSAFSDPGAASRKRKVLNPSVKVRRQLSEPSSRKFCQLGQSPDTVLEAIATCYDLTPDEWMVAWKLTHKGIPLTERAKILGVHLHNSHSDGDLKPAQTLKD